jgi:hypothetical protein
MKKPLVLALGSLCLSAAAHAESCERVAARLIHQDAIWSEGLRAPLRIELEGATADRLTFVATSQGNPFQESVEYVVRIETSALTCTATIESKTIL